MARTAASTSKAVRPARVSFVDEAYARIKQEILENVMPPGFRALEAELALRFGMSRTPVREALLRLQAEGFVRVTPRRGMLVLPISPVDMEEIYEIITALETAAIERVAQQAPRPHERSPLLACVDEMDAALAADDLERWAEADERFHRALVELSGSRRLFATATMFRDQIRRTRMLTLRLRPKPAGSNQSHRQLVAAIARRDGERACAIHRGQRRRAGQELMAILRRYRLQDL